MSQTSDVLPTSAGGAVVVGFRSGAGGGAYLAQFSSDGTPDNAFGSDGVVQVTAAPPREGTSQRGLSLSRVSSAADGLLVAGGRVEYVYTNGHDPLHDVVVYRFAPDGSPDPTFGANGAARLIPPGETRYLSFNALTVGPDGSVFAVYSPSFSGGTISKLAPDGRLDTSFGTVGHVRLSLPSLVVRDVILRPDGRLLVGGSEGGLPYGNQVILAQYLPDGSPDSTFADSGRLMIQPFSGSVAVGGMVLAPDGAVLIGGVANKDGGDTRGALVIRVRQDGQLDPAFGSGGLIWVDVAAAVGETARYEWSSRPYLRSDGGGGVVGRWSQPRGLPFVGFEADGTATAGNGPSGVRVVFDASQGLVMSSVRGDSDGAVFAVGERTTSDGMAAAFVARVIDKAQPTSTTEHPNLLDAALMVAPNPTAGAATVALTFAAPSDATIRVVDALGRTVATLTDRALPAGTTTLTVDASRLAPGVYAVVAETSAGRTTARFTVIR